VLLTSAMQLHYRSLKRGMRFDLMGGNELIMLDFRAKIVIVDHNATILDEVAGELQAIGR
jgi:hypothetical protein